MQTENQLESPLLISDLISANLKSTAGWVKVISIIGFIYSAIILIAGLVHGINKSNLTSSSGRQQHLVAGGGIFLLYLSGAVVLFNMSLLLLRFARKSTIALATANQAQLTAAFTSLNQAIKIAGIMAILSTIITALLIAGFFIVATFARY